MLIANTVSASTKNFKLSWSVYENMEFRKVLLTTTFMLIVINCFSTAKILLIVTYILLYGILHALWTTTRTRMRPTVVKDILRLVTPKVSCQRFCHFTKHHLRNVMWHLNSTYSFTENILMFSSLHISCIVNRPTFSFN